MGPLITSFRKVMFWFTTEEQFSNDCLAQETELPFSKVFKLCWTTTWRREGYIKGWAGNKSGLDLEDLSDLYANLNCMFIEGQRHKRIISHLPF